jgi:hexosaminidase
LNHRRIAGGALALIAALLAPVTSAIAEAPALQAAPIAANEAASATRLQLRWELQRNLFGEQAPHGRTRARLILTNHDSRPLPPQGWSLYFNCMDRLRPGALPGSLVLEQVAGQLFRVRPGPGFAGVAPGRTLDIVYDYAGLLIKLSKAPVGPYLVYDAAPDQGVAIQDFQLLPVTRPEQLNRGASGARPVVTPEDTYRRNARADLLPPAELPPVLPTPLQLEAGAGTLVLTALPEIDAPAALKNEAALARSLFPAALPAGGPPLTLRIGAVPGQGSPEAYRLTVGAQEGIAIVGNSAAGVAYGLQTLRELLPLPGAKELALKEVRIVDAPRFGYRGLQLDVARNFHDKHTVFKWLDLMARSKLNTLHLHLTDDEGWRLEIAGLPELTAIGALRCHSAKPGICLQPAYGSGPDKKDASGSGYFSRADYIEILRHAKARHIDVIPEIEMPGHARAAVQAMEARYRRMKAAGRKDANKYLLNDLDDRSSYISAQYYTDNVINPGLDSSFAFIEHVVAQVAALHREAGAPLRTIHVGGDELPNGAWEASPASLARMRKEKLGSTAELWDYFYDRVDGILRRQGLFASGWEEIAARRTRLLGRSRQIPNPHFVGRGFTAWVWNNTRGAEDLAYRLANAGYDIVLAPVSNMYMDMAANPNPEEPGVNWNDYVELDTVYDFIPFDMLGKAGDAGRGGMDGLTDYGKARVRGLEATLFTETVREPAQMDYLLMPRLLAVAERAWAPDPAWALEPEPAKADALHRRAWSGFVNALGRRVLPRLDLEQRSVAYRIAPPGLLVDGDQVLVNHVLPGMLLRYTSDGSEPTAASRQVDGPIVEHGIIKVAAFDRNGRRGLVASVNRP